MSTKVKTVEDVKNVATNELISLVEWQKKIPVCRFCGGMLSRYRIELGSKRFYTAKDCQCETACAARQHNKAIDPHFDETCKL